jgi:hypothetical protein
MVHARVPRIFDRLIHPPPLRPTPIFPFSSPTLQVVSYSCIHHRICGIGTSHFLAPSRAQLPASLLRRCTPAPHGNPPDCSSPLPASQAWILLEMPGFENNLEHSIFAGATRTLHADTVKAAGFIHRFRVIIVMPCLVYKWLLGDTDADDIENADIGRLTAVVIVLFNQIEVILHHSAGVHYIWFLHTLGNRSHAQRSDRHVQQVGN